MSGVYIKGMEMPTAGTVIAIYKLNGKFYASMHGTELCPLVPVPDHGDLIERDTLPWYLKDVTEILEAPTIIPADKGDEE